MYVTEMWFMTFICVWLQRCTHPSSIQSGNGLALLPGVLASESIETNGEFLQHSLLTSSPPNSWNFLLVTDFGGLAGMTWEWNGVDAQNFGGLSCCDVKQAGLGPERPGFKVSWESSWVRDCDYFAGLLTLYIRDGESYVWATWRKG